MSAQACSATLADGGFLLAFEKLQLLTQVIKPLLGSLHRLLGLLDSGAGLFLGEGRDLVLRLEEFLVSALLAFRSRLQIQIEGLILALRLLELLGQQLSRFPFLLGFALEGFDVGQVRSGRLAPVLGGFPHGVRRGRGREAYRMPV